jgi:hypothetical protein
MTPLPNCFLCSITYVISREKQRKQLGGGAIADRETDAKNASVDGPLVSFLGIQWLKKIGNVCVLQIEYYQRNNATAALFSRLGDMEDYRSRRDGKLFFALYYPELNSEKAYTFKQRDNPYNVTGNNYFVVFL